MSTDRQLLDRFLGGDTGAFDELMRIHEDRVFGICLRMMRDREAALDATQETFLTLYRKADRFHGRSAFSTWLYRVAINTCYDALRRQQRRRTEPMPQTNDPADARAGDELAAVELRPDVEAALASLTPEFRAAVVLTDLEGLSLDEVSTLLEIPIGTVKSRVFRARRQLALALGNLSTPSGLPTDEHHG